MDFKRYAVTLRGVTPLLMHKDNITWGERVQKWQKDPANKKVSVAGDDRSPGWVWLGYCYTDKQNFSKGQVFAIDADNLMSTLRDGGAKCPAAQGRGSMKAATQSGIMVDQIAWPLMVGGATMPFDPFLALADEEDFDVHAKAAEAMGFELFVKRATIGTAKHVRVRPRFEDWSCSGTLTVLDKSITRDVLEMILNFAGYHAGLCDWRPGSPKKPGQFGKFSVASLSEIKE